MQPDDDLIEFEAIIKYYEKLQKAGLKDTPTCHIVLQIKIRKQRLTSAGAEVPVQKSVTKGIL